MKVVPSNQFVKTIKKLADGIAKQKLSTLIGKLEKAKSLSDIPNVIALVNYPGHFRIRLGDYRLLVSTHYDEDELVVVVLLLDYKKRDENTYK